MTYSMNNSYTSSFIETVDMYNLQKCIMYTELCRAQAIWPTGQAGWGLAYF